MDLHIPYKYQWLLAKVIFYSCCLPSLVSVHICLPLPINHEICTLARTWHFSPFGLHLTYTCCRLLCSMSWCTKCSWLKKNFTDQMEIGSLVTEERLQNLNAVTDQIPCTHRYTGYAPIAGQHEDHCLIPWPDASVWFSIMLADIATLLSTGTEEYKEITW